eukprot:7383772-Prymnesium_polylepis.1
MPCGAGGACVACVACVAFGSSKRRARVLCAPLPSPPAAPSSRPRAPSAPRRAPSAPASPAAPAPRAASCAPHPSRGSAPGSICGPHARHARHMTRAAPRAGGGRPDIGGARTSGARRGAHWRLWHMRAIVVRGARACASMRRTQAGNSGGRPRRHRPPELLRCAWSADPCR